MCTVAPIRRGPTVSSGQGRRPRPGRPTAAASCLTSSVAGRPTMRGRGRGSLRYQHAADTGSLAGWIEKRLSGRSVRAGRIVSAGGAIRSPRPTPTWPIPDADDPLAALRRDIGGARGQVLAVESQMAACGFCRRICATKRFSGREVRRQSATSDLVELRQHVASRHRRGVRSPARVNRRARIEWASGARGLAAICRQRRLTDWRGASRRKLLAQLGVEIRIDSTPLAGRDLAGARGGVCCGLQKGGVPIADARLAAGI